MKLVPKKNGKGYTTAYLISFGSKEATDLKLIDKNGNLKEIKSAKNIDVNKIEIEFVESNEN